MAACNIPQGFKCEFVDSVPEDFYCKKCSLVARGLVMTDCCVESYCHSCIADSLQQGQSCPACGELDFTIFHQKKYHKRINALTVNCTMKERGCGWSGTLDKLDTHLDPDLDNCQYVDTKCPLHCLLTVPKNKVDQHVAQECSKRPHVCQHCGFKATYEEVMDTHLPECKYVPLVCPNRCGVTFERDFMEDHMKMCRLEEIFCEFRNVGCDGSFPREDEDKHTRENSHKHLALTASLATHSKEQLLHKLLEQEEKHKEMEAEMREKLQQQEKMIEQQERKFNEQLKMQENKLERQEKRSEKLVDELVKVQKEAEQQHKALNYKISQQDLAHRKEEKLVQQQLQNLMHTLKEQEAMFKSKLAQQQQLLTEKLTELECHSTMPRQRSTYRMASRRKRQHNKDIQDGIKEEKATQQGAFKDRHYGESFEMKKPMQSKKGQKHKCTESQMWGRHLGHVLQTHLQAFSEVIKNKHKQ